MRARRVYNRAIDRRPALIARCAGVDDIRHSLEFARHNAIQATVRAGGHHVAGRALNDGGLVIDRPRCAAFASIRALVQRTLKQAFATGQRRLDLRTGGALFRCALPPWWHGLRRRTTQPWALDGMPTSGIGC